MFQLWKTKKKETSENAHFAIHKRAFCDTSSCWKQVRNKADSQKVWNAKDKIDEVKHSSPSTIGEKGDEQVTLRIATTSKVQQCHAHTPTDAREHPARWTRLSSNFLNVRLLLTPIFYFVSMERVCGRSQVLQKIFRIFYSGEEIRLILIDSISTFIWNNLTIEVLNLRDNWKYKIPSSKHN